MSHITMSPVGRNRWNKRMIERIRAIHPRPTYNETVEVKNKTTGKMETKVVKKTLSDSDITKLVKSRYNLTSDRSNTPKVSTPTVEETV